MAKSPLIKTTSAKILPSDDELESVERREKAEDQFAPLAEWVMKRVNAWEEWRNSNYSAKWDEYERTWRGIYGGKTPERGSERSTIVTPALSEAVENGVAEIEEAAFGRGSDYFDLASPDDAVQPQPQQAPMAQAVAQTAGGPEMGTNVPEMGTYGPVPGTNGPETGMLGQPPQPPMADPTAENAAKLDSVRAALKSDLATTDFAAESTRAILYSGIFGSGFGEIVLDDVFQRHPELVGPQLVSKTKKYTCAKLRAVSPRNFVYDPNATRLAEGLGCAIVEVVSKHLILEKQKDGTYRKGLDLCESSGEADPALAGDQQDSSAKYTEFQVKQVRWYGLVPKSLLNPASAKDDAAAEAKVETIDADEDEFVEAFVVIINDANVAKAVRSPYAKQDRPIVHFPWDLVPGRLQGRGICEKGIAPQKILDAEVRSRMDSLALVTAPMMGMDASRLPRGFKFRIQPGGSVLTNGKPSDVMEPFKFGQLDPNHWQNAADIKAMVQQATGSVDAVAMAQGAGGESRTGAMSMAMAPVIKRYKRTLIHFLDEFLLPAVEMILWRNMQFNSERYPAVPFKLRPASTMGIMQREYETQQMTALLATMQPGTPEHRAILTGVVSNSSIPNREKIMQLVAHAEERAQAEAQAVQAAAEDPALAEFKKVTLQLDIAEKQLQLEKTQAEILKIRAQAAEIHMNTQLAPAEMASKGMHGLETVNEQQTAFDQRMAAAGMLLEHRKLDEKAADRQSNEAIVDRQLQTNVLTTAMKERNKHDLQRAKQPTPNA